MIRPPPRSTLFPYTTLSRSDVRRRGTERQAQADLAPALLNGVGHHAVDANGRENEGDHREGEQRQHAEPPRRQMVVDVRPHRSEEHTSELQSRQYLVCRLLL